MLPVGDNRYMKAEDQIGRKGRHSRVYRTRGPASAYGCYNRELGLRNCISQVYDWSQLHGTDGLDPLLDYYPLCRSCHMTYDVDARPGLQGSKHGRAVLTEEIVLACRRRNTAGESRQALAREFKISCRTMSRAIDGETWKHLPLDTDAPRPDTLPRGSKRFRAKLTEEIVLKCRERAAAGEAEAALAREFRVHYTVMHRAVIGSTWKHVA